jgi:hypothetical protein
MPQWEKRTVDAHFMLFFQVRPHSRCPEIMCSEFLSVRWQKRAQELEGCCKSPHLPHPHICLKVLSCPCTNTMSLNSVETELLSFLTTLSSQIVRANTWKGLCVPWRKGTQSHNISTHCPCSLATNLGEEKKRNFKMEITVIIQMVFLEDSLLTLSYWKYW